MGFIGFIGIIVESLGSSGALLVRDALRFGWACDTFG